MRIGRFGLISFLCGIGVFPLATQAQSPLTIDEAINRAFHNNPSIQAALSEPLVADAEARQAALPSNPEVSAAFRFEKGGGGEVLPRVSVSQDIWDIYLASLRKKAARSELEASKLQAASNGLKLVAEVKKAFYSLKAMEQFRAFLNESARSARAASALSAKQMEAGNINPLEHNARRLIAEEAELELIRSEAEWRQAQIRLAELMGEPQRAETIILRGAFPAPSKKVSPLETLEARALANRPDLLALRQMQTSLKESEHAAKLKTLPSLRAGFEVEKDADSTLIGPEMGLEIPLFDRSQAKRKKIRAQMKQNRYSAAGLENQIRAEVREAGVRVAEAAKIASRYREQVLPIFKETLDETGKHANFMLKGPFDLLQIKREEIRAEREYAEALRDYWIARVDLEAAIGGPEKKNE